ncbi:MAG: ABC transporter ATP-binding protein [Lentilitoribacter sp.]
MSILSVKDLSISFGHVQAVLGISFDVHKDETLCIIGESGSGKSTAAFSIMGLLPEFAEFTGRINYRDENLLSLPARTLEKIRGKRIGMIFQEPMTSLNPVLTIGKQIAEPLVFHENMSEKDALAEARKLLELVKIPDVEERLKQYPHQLSGGMRQRVMIAMALACRPDILIADEPTTALDVTIQAEVLQLLNDIRRERGLSLIFITHDLGVVAQIADRVAVMFKGEIVETAPVEKIFNDPDHEYTKSLLSAALRVDKSSAIPVPDVVMEEAGTLLEVKDLTKTFMGKRRSLFKPAFGVHAVRGVSFKIQRGETLGVVGESGCGKSTLSRCVLNLIEPTSGSVIYDGMELTTQSDQSWRVLRQKLQIVFQDPYSSLNARRTVGRTLAEPLYVHKGIKYHGALPILKKLLDEVGLPDSALDRYPHEFSGGQRQRIAIARALVLEPEFIIADEAVSALDVSIRAQILDLLRRIQKERSLSFMFITHDLAVMRNFCDRALVMYKGQVIEEGTADELMDNPQQEYTKILRNAAPVPDVSHRMQA